MKKIISSILIIIFAFSLCGCLSLIGRSSDPVLPHLLPYNERELNPIRKINSENTPAKTFSKTSSDPIFEQLDELLQIVIDNSRPTFNSSLSSEVKEVYDEAIKVLNRYIKNDFSDFEKIHTIHDYLTSKIEYDEGLYLQHIQNPEQVDAYDPSFLLSGVFLNKKAVCTGFAKAFRFLCGIEGIKTETVYGSYYYSDNFIPHIWNKVLLDGEWYNIDCTMDSIKFITEKNKTINVIHHGFFLLSDNTLSNFGGHVFSEAEKGYPASAPDYDFYSNQNVFEGSDLKMQVNSQEELNAVFEYIKNANRKIGQVELRLNLGLSDDQANFVNAYQTEITKAYDIIKDEDFSYSPTTGRIPFQKYPRGVFVFLIYK